MTRIPINPGRVDWSDENPGIYLKTDPAGDYTALALFFRVVLSPHGSGHAALVLSAPDEARLARGAQPYHDRQHGDDALDR